MKLTRAPFEKIANGSKTIESRLYDKKRQQINLGDHIKFVCSDEPTKAIMTQIKELYRYSTFNDLFSAFPPEDFGGTSAEELLKEIYTFYSKNEEIQYGVFGIRVELVE